MIKWMDSYERWIGCSKAVELSLWFDEGEKTTYVNLEIIDFDINDPFKDLLTLPFDDAPRAIITFKELREKIELLSDGTLEVFIDKNSGGC